MYVCVLCLKGSVVLGKNGVAVVDNAMERARPQNQGAVRSVFPDAGVSLLLSPTRGSA